MKVVLYVPLVRLKASLKASEVCAMNTSGYRKWNNAHNSCNELLSASATVAWNRSEVKVGVQRLISFIQGDNTDRVQITKKGPWTPLSLRYANNESLQ